MIPTPFQPLSNGTHEEFLDAAGAKLRAHLVQPTKLSPVEISAIYSQLVQLPPDFVHLKRVRCLLDVAQCFYVTGRSIVGLTPAQESVSMARLTGDGKSVVATLTNFGVLNADTGNLSSAISAHAEALDLAIQIKYRDGETVIWNNLGVSLLYAAQYQDAIECFERVVQLSGDDPSKSGAKAAALGNIGLCYLHLEDIRKGLRVTKQAIDAHPEPINANETLSRVLSETNYCRLSLEVDNLDRAKERCEIAKRYAKISNSERAQLEADISEGLYEVHAGLVDVGLSRLHQALERARLQRSALRDALIAMVKAHEVIGQPERALSFLRELMLHTRKVQQENVLQHHRRHLAQLEEDQESSNPGQVDVLRRREVVLRGQMAELELAQSRQKAERDLMRSRIEMLERLAVTAELRDDSTGEHSYRVGRLSALLATEYGCDDTTVFMVDLAARLHDIGKIGIPDGILLKPGKLNPAERQIMETHTTVGAELLAQSDIPHMQMAEEIARHHHEWWDGSGYPTGICGKAIPVGARIAALADVFDALTHKRPYKDPWPVAHALAEIERLKGKQFDPELADLFLALVRRLQREEGDLDLYLGQAAQESPFVQARRKIAAALHRSSDDRGNNGSGADLRFDTQR